MESASLIVETALLWPPKGIARRHAAAPKPRVEPLHPLPRRPMRERLWAHMPGGHFLQAVIAHRRRRAERRLHVSLLQQSALLCGVRPHAREAVRLQFQPHREGVRFARVAFLHLTHFAFDAQQFLHVMSQFVR